MPRDARENPISKALCPRCVLPFDSSRVPLSASDEPHSERASSALLEHYDPSHLVLKLQRPPERRPVALETRIRRATVAAIEMHRRLAEAQRHVLNVAALVRPQRQRFREVLRRGVYITGDEIEIRKAH